MEQKRRREEQRKGRRGAKKGEEGVGVFYPRKKLKTSRDKSQSSHRTPCYLGSDSNKSAKRGVSPPVRPWDMLRGFNQRCSKSSGTSNREHARPTGAPTSAPPGNACTKAPLFPSGGTTVGSSPQLHRSTARLFRWP